MPPNGRRRAFLLVLALLLYGTSLAQELPQLPEETEEPQLVRAVPDSLLGARLRSIFTNIEIFGNVNASVTEGVVRLGGTVDRPEHRRRVEELAASLEGIVYVVNGVETSTDIETRLTPAMRKVQDYWDTFIEELPVLVVALIVLLLFIMASALLGRWRRPGKWTGINPLVWGFFNRLLRGILVMVGFLLAFDILGIASLMGAVLGTAGIVGIALGFAFRDIVENYLAGMLLSLRRPFSVNDLVRLGEFEGWVVRMTSRELVLLSFEGNHIRLPNSHVFKTPLVNFTINPRRLFSVEIGIGTEEDLQVAMRVGTETIAAMKGVMEDPPPFARVIEVGDSAVKVRYHGWVDQREADFLKVRSEGVRLVKEALDEASIELPEPIYRVVTQPMREPKSPAGPRQQSRAREQASAIDVSPDGKIDEQVREDSQRSGDQNLLEER